MNNFWYEIYDYFLSFLHILLIVFNLFGWIFPKIRKYHFISLLLVLFSWTVLGIFFGMGYCPLTHLQWNVKEKLGYTDLPYSYIKYIFDSISLSNISERTVDIITVVTFVLCFLLSIYVNFLKKKTHKKI